MPRSLEHAGRTLTVDDDWTIEVDSWVPGRVHRCELKHDDLAAAFGVGLVVRGLLPNIDVDLPDIPFPDLFGWLPDIHIASPNLPDLPDLHTQYWVPVVIAVGAAVGETRRRRRARDAKRDAGAAARGDGD